jgi:hypothetical protein
MKKFIDKRWQARIAGLGLCAAHCWRRLNGAAGVRPRRRETLGAAGRWRCGNCARGQGGLRHRRQRRGRVADAVAIRRKEAAAAQKVLGVDDMVFLDEPDGSFRNSPRFEAYVSELFREFQPDWLFLPSVLDYHRDHVAIGQALLGCWRRWDGASRAFFYEIWSRFPPPGWWISAAWPRKNRRLPAMNCRWHRLPRASMGLASYCRTLSAGPGAEIRQPKPASGRLGGHIEQC